jgi:hypothetical protein
MGTTLRWVPVGHASGEIRDSNDSLLARYQWAPTSRQPFFHPVCTYAAAEPLTCHAPFDHPWHRGLWWAWKFINGVVFWEDRPGYGEGEGESIVVSHLAGETTGGRVAIRQGLEMRPVGSAEVYLRETRLLIAHPEVPAIPGAWAIDWDVTTTATVRCVLNTTPYPEHTWGGYMGLSFRPNRSMGWGEEIRNSQDGSGQPVCHGSPARWASYSGLLDGDSHGDPANPSRGGLAILDHAGNPRHPTHFYCWSTGSQNRDFGFLAASLLMREALVLEAGESLRLRYRSLFFGGSIDAERLDRAWHDYQLADTSEFTG